MIEAHEKKRVVAREEKQRMARRKAILVGRGFGAQPKALELERL